MPKYIILEMVCIMQLMNIFPTPVSRGADGGCAYSVYHKTQDLLSTVQLSGRTLAYVLTVLLLALSVFSLITYSKLLT